MINDLQYLIDIYYDNTIDEALISTDEDGGIRPEGDYVFKTKDDFTYAYFIDPDVVEFVDIMSRFPNETDINDLIFGFLKKLSDNLERGQPFDEIILIADNFIDFLNFFGIPVKNENLQDSLISICNGKEDIVQQALLEFHSNEDGKAIDRLAHMMRRALDEQSKIEATPFDPTGYDGAAFYYITDNLIQDDDYDRPEYQEQPPAEQIRVEVESENPFARRSDITRQQTLDPSAFTFPQETLGPSLFDESPGFFDQDPTAFSQQQTQDPNAFAFPQELETSGLSSYRFGGPPQTEEKVGYPQLARSFSDGKIDRESRKLVFDTEDENAQKSAKKSRSANSSPRDFSSSFQPSFQSSFQPSFQPSFSFNPFAGGKRTRKYRRKPKKTLKRRKNKKTRKPKRKPRKTLKNRKNH